MPEPIQTPEGTEEEQQGSPKPAEPQQPAQPKPEETVEFWKQKFSASASEANLLREAEEQRKKAAQELTKQPTDSDLRAAFPEWDTLSEFEKRMARETFEAKHLAGTAAQATRQMQEDRAWNTSIELALSSDQALQGKEQEFRQFASRPQYRGAPMDLIKDSFLQRAGATPAPTSTPTPKPGLETGTGGPKTPDRPKLLSADELRTLRKTDEKAYVAYIKAHPDALDADL